MAADEYGVKDHWKCLLACFLLCLSPFQYGVDFGLIGGMQAMVGFLKVCFGVSFALQSSQHGRYSAIQSQRLLSAGISPLKSNSSSRL